MNSILSIVMVIVMAFSSIGGVTAALKEPVSFDAKINVDADGILALAGTAATEETKQTITIVKDIVGALTLKGVADKDNAELDLLAGNDVMLSIGVKNAEDGGLLAASSLLGSQVISVSAETVQALQQQMQASMTEASAGMGGLENLDKEQIAKDFAEIVEKAMKAFEEKKGETETGDFTVDDLKFTAKTPVNMTYTEFMELVLNSAKELLAKESLQPVVQAASKDKDLIAEIDKEIEKLNSMPEEEKPEVQFALYSNENEGGYFVCDLTKAAKEETEKPETMHVGIGGGEDPVRIRFSFEQNQETMSIAADVTKDNAADLKAHVNAKDGSVADIAVTCDAAGSLDMAFDINSKDAVAKILAKTEPVEGERTKYSLDVFMNNAEQPLVNITGSVGKGGEAVSVYEGEDITVLPFEALMNDTDGTASGKLQITLTAGILKAITVLTKNLPEETGTWLNKQIMQQMMPKTTTITKTQTETVTAE